MPVDLVRGSSRLSTFAKNDDDYGKAVDIGERGYSDNRPRGDSTRDRDTEYSKKKQVLTHLGRHDLEKTSIACLARAKIAIPELHKLVFSSASITSQERLDFGTRRLAGGC